MSGIEGQDKVGPDFRNKQTCSKKRIWITSEYNVSATSVGKFIDRIRPLNAELATSWNQKMLMTRDRQKSGRIQSPPKVYESRGRNQNHTVFVSPDPDPRVVEINNCSIGIRMYSNIMIEACHSCFSIEKRETISLT